VPRWIFLLTFFPGAGGVSTLLLTGLAGSAPTTPAGRSGSGSSVANDIRSKIVGLNAEVTLGNGSKAPLINFDNAATTPAFTPVLEEVNAQLEFYGSIGRGFGQKPTHSTEIDENGRQIVMDFVNADREHYTVLYVNNTTDGINKLSSALITSKSDIVLTSRMEHHANDLPWRKRATTIYAEVDSLGRLVSSDVERLLSQNKVKYVSITAAPNVTGYVNDVHAIAKLAHQYHAQIIVDGAQIVAHKPFSMRGHSTDENIDYFVFSGHKMYAPYGGGAVVGLTDELNKHLPQFYGGGMVDVVSDYTETYPNAPARYEAGSPNYPGVVAMLKAIDLLKETGFDYIVEHEQHLMRKIIAGLQEIGRVTLYGDTETSQTSSALSCSISLEDLTAKLRRRSRIGVLSLFAKALFARTPMCGDC
jgi:cysteine desulfurase / selenocysteine lyase